MLRLLLLSPVGLPHGLDGLHVAVVVVLPTNTEEEGITPLAKRFEQNNHTLWHIFPMHTRRQTADLSCLMPGDVCLCQHLSLHAFLWKALQIMASERNQNKHF